MPLLSDADRTTLVQHLAPIGKPVDLLLFTQTIRRQRERAAGQAGARRSGLAARQDRRRREELRPRHRGSREVRRRQVAGDRRAVRRRRHPDAALRRADRLRVRLAGRGRAARRHRHAGARARDDHGAGGRRPSRCTCRSSPPRLDRTVPGRSSWRTSWPSPIRTSPPIRSTRSSSWTCRAATA